MTQIDDHVSLHDLLELNSGTVDIFFGIISDPYSMIKQSQLPAFSFKYLIVIDDEL